MPCQLQFLYPIPYQQQMGLVYWQHLTSNSWDYSTSTQLPNVEFPFLCTLIQILSCISRVLMGWDPHRDSLGTCLVVPIGKWTVAQYKPASSTTRTPFSKVLNPDPPEEICIGIFVLLLLFSLQGSSSIVPSMLQSAQLLVGSSSPVAPFGLRSVAADACKSQLHQCLQGWNDPSAAPTSAY